MQLCEFFFFVLFHVIILNVAHTTRRKNREKPDNFQKPPKNDFTVVYGKLSFWVKYTRKYLKHEA